MDADAARRYVDAWVDRWNAHDVEAILEHFADDVVFSSPLAARVVEGSGGVVHGKAALRAYWTRAKRQVPDLRFEIVGTYIGVHTLVINCRNQRGGLVNEVLIFDGDQIVAGHATHLHPTHLHRTHSDATHREAEDT